MRRPVAVLRATGLLCATLLLAGACSDDEPSAPGGTIVGAWSATSFTGLGTDFITAGMQLSATFTSEGNYTFTFVNDMVDACGGQNGCTQTGGYVTSAGNLTLDPGTEDEITFAYSIVGSTMTWTGAIEETPVTIIMVRAQ